MNLNLLYKIQLQPYIQYMCVVKRDKAKTEAKAVKRQRQRVKTTKKNRFGHCLRSPVTLFFLRQLQ